MVRLINCDSVYFRSKSGDSILEDVSLTVNEGEIVNIIGPNGGGKTTLLRIMLGVLKPFSGKMFVSKRHKISYMPQKLKQNDLLPVTVKFFLTFGMIIRNLDPMVEEHGIEHLLDKQLTDLSGGELQKILFFRAIIQDPDILFLDEPTQGLDINGQEKFFEQLTNLNQKKNKTIIMVSHDLYTVMSSTNRVICLNKHICCSGQPSEVERNSKYKDIFGRRHQHLSYYKHEHNHEH